MAKSTKLSARNSDVVKRGNSFSIDPRLIVVDFDKNPRKRVNYGTPEEWEAFKDSIREYGVEQNVKCAVNQSTGEWHLTHGFRRMTAVLELISEGVDIPAIYFDEDVDNEEQNLLSHLVLNNGLPMTDDDIAETLYRLKKRGYDNLAELARKSGVHYRKVMNLISYAELASKKVKDSVANGEMSMTVAMNIIKTATTTTEQNEMLEEGRRNVEISAATATTPSQQQRRIHNRDIKKVKAKTLSFEEKMHTLVEMSKEMSGESPVDIAFVNKLEGIMNAVSSGSYTRTQIIEEYFLTEKVNA